MKGIVGSGELEVPLSGESRRPLGLGESWGFDPEQASPMAPRQVRQHALLLLQACRHHRQHPLHEPAAHLAVGPATGPPPDDRVPQRTLGRVVRRLDAIDARKGPEAVPNVLWYGGRPVLATVIVN